MTLIFEALTKIQSSIEEFQKQLLIGKPCTVLNEAVLNPVVETFALAHIKLLGGISKASLLLLSCLVGFCCRSSTFHSNLGFFLNSFLS